MSDITLFDRHGALGTGRLSRGALTRRQEGGWTKIWMAVRGLSTRSGLAFMQLGEMRLEGRVSSPAVGSSVESS